MRFDQDTMDQWKDDALNTLREASERLTEALRAYLQGGLKAQTFHGPISGALSTWAAEARIENLAEWLEAEGWDQLTEKDRQALSCAVEKSFRNVAPVSSAATAYPMETLRWMFNGAIWHGLASGLSEAPGERWLRLLAGAWLMARRKAEEIHAAKPMHPRTTETGGHIWARLPKVAGGLSWAMGGQGVTVELDGHTFSPAPGMGARGQLQRANMPPGYVLLPADHAKRPHQAALPIDAGEDAPPLAVAVAGATQYALTAAAGKLGLYVMASSLDGTPRKTTLRDLTRAINPGARLVATHYNTAAAGLVELANLRLFMPSGWAHAVFYMPALPWKELGPDQYDAPLVAGMDPALVSLLLAKENPATTPFRGWFLVDLTGAMTLPTKQAGLLRQYLRTAATWNAYWEPGKGPDPGRIPTIQTERWAALVNALPLAAVDYLQAGRHKPQGRNRLSDAISKVLGDVEDLQARGLVVIDKANRKEIRLLPPEIYLAAWRDAKKGGRQKPLVP